MRRRLAGPLSLCLGLLLALTSRPAVGGEGSASEKAAPPVGHLPEWVGPYFAKMVGTWNADNAAHRSEAEPFEAYGMDWKLGPGGKSLVRRLYGIRDGKDVGTSWEFREFWHPGEGHLVASQFGSDGTYGTGPHERRADGQMEMLQTFYAPTGAVSRVGHRSELKVNELVTRSFDVQADATWKERRKYVWLRKN